MEHTATLPAKTLLKHPMIRLLLAFALLQGLYWTLFYPNFVTYSSQPAAFFEVTAVEIAQLDGADAADVAAAKFIPYAPKPELFDKGLHVVRGTYTIPEVPQSGAALLGITQGDNQRYFVNGKLLKSKGSMNPDTPTYNSNMKRIEQIPPDMLKVGENTVETIVTLGLARTILVAPPLLAEHEQAVRSHGWSEFLNADFRNITLAMTLVVVLLVGAVAVRARDKAFPVWLFLLSASWAGSTLLMQWVNLPLHGYARGFTSSVLFLFMSAAWPCLVDAWTQKSSKLFQLAMLGMFGLGALYIAYWTFIGQSPSATDRADTTLETLGTFFVAMTVIRIILHFVRTSREHRVWEGAVLLLLAFLSAMFLYDNIVLGTNIGYLQKAQPILIIALSIGFFAGRFQLFRSAEQINSELQERLDQREAELAIAHARETDLVRRETLNEERQRIMRDMHDGLGSQLMSMLLAARRGKAEPPKVAEGLQQVVDEMRLMIDSMDSLGESLSSAFASFRNRLQPRIEDAGFSFAWIDRVEGELPTYPPRTSLQIFRIMQEAVTNALKHSGGKSITVTVSADPAQLGALTIMVDDDGAGFSARKGGADSGGHGLDNMRARAASIGGTIYFEQSEFDGGRVRLDIPGKAD